MSIHKTVKITERLKYTIALKKNQMNVIYLNELILRQVNLLLCSLYVEMPRECLMPGCQGNGLFL